MKSELNKFIEFIETLSHDDLKIKVSENFYVKDIISEAVGWIEEYAGVLIDSFMNQTKPWFLTQKDFLEFNLLNVNKYKEYSKEKLIERAKYLAVILDEEIKDIGINNLKEKEDYLFLFENSIFIKYLSDIKKAIKK